MALATTANKPGTKKKQAPTPLPTGGLDRFFAAADQGATPQAAVTAARTPTPAPIPAPTPAPSPVVPAGGFDRFFAAADQGATPQAAIAAARTPEQQALDNLGLGGAQPPPQVQVGQPVPPAGVSSTPPGPVTDPTMPPGQDPRAWAQMDEYSKNILRRQAGMAMSAGANPDEVGGSGVEPPPPPPPPAPAAFSNGPAQNQGAVQPNTPLTTPASQVTPTAAPVASIFNAGTNAALDNAQRAPAIGGGAYAEAQGPAIAALLDQQARQSQTQQDLVQRLGQEAERAGMDAASNLALPKFQQPEVRTAFGTTAVAPRTQSSIQQALEQRILESLMAKAGQDDPQTALLRAQYEEDAKNTERQTIEDLQRFGALQGGDTIDVLGSLRGKRDLGRLDLNARAAQSQQAMLDRAMAYEQAQNALGLQEAELVGNLRGTATLPAQLAQADVGLALAQLDQENRQFEGGYNLQRLGLQQEVADRTLARGLTQTSPTQREIFGESQRGALTAEDLARRSLAQQGQQFTSAQQLERELAAGQVSLGANRAPVSTLAAQSLGLQRGQLLGEVDGQQTLEARNAASARDLAAAELYGVGAGGQRTLGAQALAQEGALANRALTLDERTQQQARELALAELLGDYGGRQTLGARTLDANTGLQQRALGQTDRSLGLQETAANRANALATAELYGTGPGGQRTLGAQDLALRNRALTGDETARTRQLDLAEGELLGSLGGRDTLSARALTGDETARTRQLDLAEGELLGSLGGRDTLSARALTGDEAARNRQLSLAEQQRRDQVNQEQLNRNLTERLSLADLLGYYTDPTSGSRTQTMGARQQATAEELAIGELLGRLRGQDTLGARQLTQQGSQFDRSLGLEERGLTADTEARNRALNQGDQQLNQSWAELMGVVPGYVTGGAPGQTLAARDLSSREGQQRFANELAQAELYGAGNDGRQTLQARNLTDQRILDRAGVLLAAGGTDSGISGEEYNQILRLLDQVGLPYGQQPGAGQGYQPPDAAMLEAIRQSLIQQDLLRR